MKRTKLLSLLLVFVLVGSLALTACGGDDSSTDEGSKDESSSKELAEEQVLRMNWNSEPPSLDPQISQDATSSRILIDTLDGLIRLNEEGLPEEGSAMAESWEVNEDGTEYIFKLRDAKWSDGEPVTAQDFEYSWLRGLDPKTASTYAYMLYDIVNAEAYNSGDIKDSAEVGIKAEDEKTLKVTLKSPNPAFLSKLQNSIFLPARQDKVEEWGEKYASDVEYMVSNGAFKVTEWEHENKLVMEKNDNYWDAENVTLDKVEGIMTSDPNTIINLYETGELDVINVPSQYLEKYKDDLIKSPEASTFYYTFNTENEFFKNAKIRKAFGMAIDREKIQQARTEGIVPPAWAFVPPGIPGPGDKTFREANGELLKDVGNGSSAEEAKKLLEEGLEEIGKTVEDMNGIKFLTFDSENSLQRAQIWQQYWKENLGVEVGIDTATFKVKIDRENKKDFAFSYSGWVGDYNDPMTFMDMWITDGPQNTAGWSNAEYDELIKTAQTTTGEERMQAMMDAEKILIDEMVVSPTDHSVKIYLQNPKVDGIVRLPLAITNGYKTAYITK
ncbi:peptide ABC transporter substrate-binding protein [Senegalia massiliensis]|uniref:Peptide ABC transporter substrate-binding protein n=1 Tax=Senegalia massiliensis TaxID=1720316 RepID=A0A845QWE0_9CLOT|nr:peptide ABC transporter substrate-binding protein [Senegalia massiliensis]NBI07227.1 peptide ABC transporter substrate-binding protein [Senegalia massiliensis]